MKLVTTPVALAALFMSASLALAHGEHQHGVSSATAAGEPGDPSKPSRDVVVVMLDADGRMVFQPDAVTVSRGEQIRFQLRNEGVLAHEFLVGTSAEIDEHAEIMKAMPDMAHDDPNAKRLEAKASGELVWRFTTPGEFTFACLIPGHREAGMTGKIVVR